MAFYLAPTHLVFRCASGFFCAQPVPHCQASACNHYHFPTYCLLVYHLPQRLPTPPNPMPACCNLTFMTWDLFSVLAWDPHCSYHYMILTPAPCPVACSLPCALGPYPLYLVPAFCTSPSPLSYPLLWLCASLVGPAVIPLDLPMPVCPNLVPCPHPMPYYPVTSPCVPIWDWFPPHLLLRHPPQTLTFPARFGCTLPRLQTMQFPPWLYVPPSVPFPLLCIVSHFGRTFAAFVWTLYAFYLPSALITTGSLQRALPQPATPSCPFVGPCPLPLVCPTFPT